MLGIFALFIICAALPAADPAEDGLLSRGLRWIAGWFPGQHVDGAQNEPDVEAPPAGVPEFSPMLDMTSQEVFEKTWLAPGSQVRFLYLPKGRRRYSMAYDVRDLCFAYPYTQFSLEDTAGQPLLSVLHDQFLQGFCLAKEPAATIVDADACLATIDTQNYERQPFSSEIMEGIFQDICAHIYDCAPARSFAHEGWLELSSKVAFLRRNRVEWSVVDRELFLEEAREEQRTYAKIFMILQGEKFVLKGAFPWHLLWWDVREKQSLWSDKIAGVGPSRLNLVPLYSLPEMRPGDPGPFDEWMRGGQVRIILMCSHRRFSATYDLRGFLQKPLSRGCRVLPDTIVGILEEHFLLGRSWKEGCVPDGPISQEWGFRDVDVDACNKNTFVSMWLQSFLWGLSDSVRQEAMNDGTPREKFSYGWERLTGACLRANINQVTFVWDALSEKDFYRSVQEIHGQYKALYILVENLGALAGVHSLPLNPERFWSHDVARFGIKHIWSDEDLRVAPPSLLQYKYTKLCLNAFTAPSGDPEDSLSIDVAEKKQKVYN